MFLPRSKNTPPSKIGLEGAERYRARELAQMIMDAEIPGALIDPQTTRAHGIESFQDIVNTDTLNDLTGNIRMPTDRANPPLQGTFQQWERSMGPSGRVAELDETHTSPEQMQLLDDQLTAIPGAYSQSSQYYKSEPMDIAMRLLKERVSPEAIAHKLEYDKKYESNPVRVKYREDLNRERRRRHIMGQGGPDMSHTRQHTIVPEDPHTNRARHFKDKGTLL